MSFFDYPRSPSHRLIHRRLPHLLIRTDKSKTRSTTGATSNQLTTQSGDIARRLLHLEKIFALGIGKENSHLTLPIDGKTEPLTPEQFLRVIPTGSLEGYH